MLPSSFCSRGVVAPSSLMAKLPRRVPGDPPKETETTHKRARTVAAFQRSVRGKAGVVSDSRTTRSTTALRVRGQTATSLRDLREDAERNRAEEALIRAAKAAHCAFEMPVVALCVHLACCRGACVQMFALFLFSSRPPPNCTTPNIFGKSGFELSSRSSF